jgi:preprotein translocase subunit SecG
MIYYAIATLHVIVCIILVLVVLLQSGKGADLAGAFGGGATQTAFGSRGPASFLSKMTTVAAIIFMLTSIGLSMISTRSESKSILEMKKQTTQPARKAPAEGLPAIPAETPDQIQKRLEELQRKQQQAAPTPTPAQENAKPTPKAESSKQPAQK